MAYQAHPALVKIGLVLACLFHFNSLLVALCIRLVKVLRTPCVCHKRLVEHPPVRLTDRVPSQPGAMAALWRRHPAGT